MFAYRNTPQCVWSPHPAIGRSPAEAMFGRKINDGLPTVTSVSNDKIQQRDQQYKSRYRRTSKFPNLNIGNKVLLKRLTARRKLESRFDPTVCTITGVRGPDITVLHPDGHYIRRHISHVKVLI